MNDYPDRPEDFFDPSAFDADAFLSESQSEIDLFNADVKAIEAEEMAAESTVMKALEKVGFPVSPIQEMQSRLAPDQPLSYSLAKMIPIQEHLRATERLEDATVLHSIIVISFAIQQVAGEKHISDMLDYEMQPTCKQQQQSAIYANDQLPAEYKEFFLAALDELYPGIEGLKPDSPDTDASIQDFDQYQNTLKEISDKARELREFADTELRNAMLKHGLGNHDKLDSIANSIAIILTRMHVIEAGDYDKEIHDLTEMSTSISLKSIFEEVFAMGWSKEQFELILQRVRKSLRQDESE